MNIKNDEESLLDETVFYGSENVFADLGHADAKAKLFKSRLISVFNKLLEERGLSQKKAAKLLGIDQSNLSKILRGHLRLVTSDKLIEWMDILGADIETKVISKPCEHHGISVEFFSEDLCPI